jgi:lauroyl/myristoyl acyltransferase
MIKIFIFVCIIYLILKLLIKNYLLKIFYYISIMLTPLILFFTEKHKRLTCKNLDLVFNNSLSINQKINLLYKSMNLLILNILIALSQRFLFDKDYMIKNYKLLKIPSELKSDVKNNKIIIAMMHYGIFYDFTTYFKILGSLTFIFKNNGLKFIFNEINLNIIPIEYKNVVNNYEKLFDKNIIYLVCDHKKIDKNQKYNFMNQSTSFHESAANIHKITKRSIWIMIPKFNFEEISIDLEFIPVQRDYDNTPKKIITQNIADIFSKEILNSPEQYLWNFKRF